jgi:MFS family permease
VEEASESMSGAGKPIPPADRRNVMLNAAGEGIWGLGWNLAPPLTVLPLLIRALGGGALEVGILAAVASAGSLLPQILGSFVLQSGEGRKRFLVLYHLGVVVPPWLCISAVIFFAASTHPQFGRFALISLHGLSVFAIGFIVPVWNDWLAGLFAKGIRGFAFGMAGATSAGLGALGALVASRATSRFAFPLNYALLFLTATAVMCVSMAVFARMREQLRPRRPRLPGRDVYRRFAQSMRDANFRTYLVSRILLTLGAAPISFLAVHYSTDRGGAVADSVIIALGSLLLASQSVFSVVIGKFGDRFGHRAGATIGSAAQAVAIVFAVFFPGAVSCAFAFILTGIAVASTFVSHQNFLFETCPHDSRPVHTSLANIVLAPVAISIPLIAGRTIAAFGTFPVFLGCLVPTSAAIAWLHLVVKDPKTASPAEAANAEA